MVHVHVVEIRPIHAAVADDLKLLVGGEGVKLGRLLHRGGLPERRTLALHAVPALRRDVVAHRALAGGKAVRGARAQHGVGVGRRPSLRVRHGGHRAARDEHGAGDGLAHPGRGWRGDAVGRQERDALILVGDVHAAGEVCA